MKTGYVHKLAGEYQCCPWNNILRKIYCRRFCNWKHFQ